MKYLDILKQSNYSIMISLAIAAENKDWRRKPNMSRFVIYFYQAHSFICVFHICIFYGKSTRMFFAHDTSATCFLVIHEWSLQGFNISTLSDAVMQIRDTTWFIEWMCFECTCPVRWYESRFDCSLIVICHQVNSFNFVGTNNDFSYELHILPPANSLIIVATPCSWVYW